MLVVPLQTFKLLLILPHFLVPTLFAVSDFTQQLATIEEQHGEQLQQLVETFRIRNAELRKERWVVAYWSKIANVKNNKCKYK